MQFLVISGDIGMTPALINKQLKLILLAKGVDFG